ECWTDRATHRIEQEGIALVELCRMCGLGDLGSKRQGLHPVFAVVVLRICRVSQHSKYEGAPKRSLLRLLSRVNRLFDTAHTSWLFRTGLSARDHRLTQEFARDSVGA